MDRVHGLQFFDGLPGLFPWQGERRSPLRRLSYGIFGGLEVAIPCPFQTVLHTVPCIPVRKGRIFYEKGYALLTSCHITLNVQV